MSTRGKMPPREPWQKPPEPEEQKVPTLGKELVCRTCVFFQPYAVKESPSSINAHESADGLCRVDAPKIFAAAMIDEAPRGQWPVVDADKDYCGEHLTETEYNDARFGGEDDDE